MPDLSSLKSSVGSFLSAAPGAIAGHLNVPELKRIVLTTVLSSGGVAAIGPALLASVGTVVAPQDAALATALVTVATEVYRRLPQGSPVPARQS